MKEKIDKKITPWLKSNLLNVIQPSVTFLKLFCDPTSGFFNTTKIINKKV